MKSKILLAFTLIFGAYLMQSCNNNQKKTAEDQSMNHMNGKGMMNMDNSMMKAMESKLENFKEMKPSGDFDCDFANMMIMHHQSAVAMSNFEIANGTNQEIKMIAEQIKKAQTNEISEMHKILNNFKINAPDRQPIKVHEELSESMQNMMDQMNGVKMTGNTDKDYASMMIPHHESALKMAQDELKYGKQPALKKMAEQMISVQENEIKQFKEMLLK